MKVEQIRDSSTQFSSISERIKTPLTQILNVKYPMLV